MRLFNKAVMHFLSCTKIRGSQKIMSTSLKPPFKGRPAADLVKYTQQCLSDEGDLETKLGRFNDLVVFLLDMDTDCNPKQEITTSTDNPNGLSAEAMVEKMDILLHIILSKLAHNVSDDFYVGLLEIFEGSVLKLYQPHYIQFITYFVASASKERADNFLSLLLNIVHDEQSDPIARREAISFIGSFACRATFLGWTHSARTAKYLVSFMHTLNPGSSSSDRMLLVLTLQTVCYMLCWECNRWKDHVDSSEFDWIWRSKKGLVPLLTRLNADCVLRLVSLDILTMLHPLVGRVSVQLRDFVGEALATYKQLLPPLWKPLSESKLLKPNFPFDPFHNLPRTCPLISPLCREWEDAGDAPDASDGGRRAVMTTDESGADDGDMADSDEGVDETWSFHPITKALTGGHHEYQSSPLLRPMRPDDEDQLMLGSPLLELSEDPPMRDTSDNIVLTRILSSKMFASAPLDL